MTQDQPTDMTAACQQGFRQDAAIAEFGYGVPVFEAQIESLRAVVERLDVEVETLRRERDMWRHRAEGSSRLRRWFRRAC